MSVLLLDDEIEMHDVMSQLYKDISFIHASCVKGGVRALEEETIELVIADVILRNRGNGYLVCDYAKALSIPSIIFSGVLNPNLYELDNAFPVVHKPDLQGIKLVLEGFKRKPVLQRELAY
ncbi:hypothetical protein ES702_05225 [subsurface metagenome]